MPKVKIIFKKPCVASHFSPRQSHLIGAKWAFVCKFFLSEPQSRMKEAFQFVSPIEAKKTRKRLPPPLHRPSLLAVHLHFSGNLSIQSAISWPRMRAGQLPTASQALYHPTVQGNTLRGEVSWPYQFFFMSLQFLSNSLLLSHIFFVADLLEKKDKH